MEDMVKGAEGAHAASEEAPMPRNVVGGTGGAAPGGAARLPQLSEAEWRAQNMPKSRLVVRWGYRGGQVQLLNRRMRNLAERQVGPAMCAWIRERVEWEAANRLRELPDGVVVVDVDPAGEGSVDVRVDALGESPDFTRDMLDGSVPADLHPWVVTAGGCVRRLRADEAGGAHGEAADVDAIDAGAGASAIDRLVLDLAKTLGFAAAEAPADGADGMSADGAAADAAGYFATSEEWGLVPCAGDEDLKPVRKLASCFDTLWNGKAGI